jgi:hypothetical protein
MNRIILYLVAILILFSNCDIKNGQSGKIQLEGSFSHAVLIWFDDSDDKNLLKSFEEDCADFINKSEFIVSYHLGKPASTNRPIIDNSYTYCLIVTFESEEDQEKYQEEMVHKEFVEKYKEHWSKLLIYDSISIL